ncbi:MAG: nitroreductase, partial [Bacillota bacterium]
MEALENIKSRQSYRAFKPDPIPGEVLKEVIEAASNSPTYMSTQPWEMAVVTGNKKDQLSDKLLELAKTNAPTNPDVSAPPPWPEEMDRRKHEHGARRLKTIGIKKDDTEGREALRLLNFDFYGAPCAVFLYMDGSLGEWSVFDMGLFTQSLLLAAHAKEIGSVIQASVTGYAPEIKEFLGINPDKKLLICISMGYPDPNAILNTYRSLKKKPE